MESTFTIISTIGSLLLSLASIIVSVWIAVTVTNRLNKEIAIKSFYLDELKAIQNEYSLFFNNIFLNKKSAITIKNWLKIMSLRNKTFEESIKRVYKTKKINIDLVNYHFQLQSFVTGTDDYNDCYKKKYVIFSGQEKENILTHHYKIRAMLMDLAVTINGLKSKKKKSQNI